MSEPAPDVVRFDLLMPVTAKGITIDHLDLVEPRAGQVCAAEAKLDVNMSQASVTAYQQELIRLVAKVDLALVGAIPVRQFDAAFEILKAYIADDPYEGVDVDGSLPDTWDMPLDPPLSWGGGQVLSVPLREPTSEELRKARSVMRSGITPHSHREYEMQLLTMVSGLNPGVIAGLRITDLQKASRYLAGFIFAGRKAGSR